MRVIGLALLIAPMFLAGCTNPEKVACAFGAFGAGVNGQAEPSRVSEIRAKDARRQPSTSIADSRTMPAAFVFSSTEFNAYRQAAAQYQDCIENNAKRFARTSESPNDIASAALSACSSASSDLHISVLALGTMSESFKDDRAIMRDFAEHSRSSAIKTVLNLRYPDSAK